MRTQKLGVLATAWLLLALFTAGGFNHAIAATKKKKAVVSATAREAQRPTTHVFRCSNQYQSEPCQTLDTSSRIVPVKDTRTVDQVRAAFEANKKAQADMKAAEKAISKRAKAASAGSSAAIGLSCHKPGARPFEPCAGQLTSINKMDKNKKGKKSPATRKPTADRYLAVSPEAP